MYMYCSIYLSIYLNTHTCIYIHTYIYSLGRGDAHDLLQSPPGCAGRAPGHVCAEMLRCIYIELYLCIYLSIYLNATVYLPFCVSI